MIILIIVICLFVIVLYFNVTDNKNLSPEEQIFEDEEQLNIAYKDRYYNKKEPEFYHPVTGYKDTRAEMDTYIVNRERKLKNL